MSSNTNTVVCNSCGASVFWETLDSRLEQMTDKQLQTDLKQSDGHLHKLCAS